jgi:CRP-like cAMP-binding protein
MLSSHRKAKPHRSVKAILGRISLFANLAAEHMNDLAAASRRASFERNEAIYRAGDSVDEMYFLLSGQVKLALSSSQGQEKVINVAEPGLSFGEAELFGGRRCLTSAVAIMPSQVLCIAGENIRRVLTTDPELAMRVMRLLAQRQLELENELAARYFRTGSQRLLDYFVKLAGPTRDTVGETPVTLRTTKLLLASRFDIKPETLSRALRDLAEAGLIAAEGNQVRLMNAPIAHYLAHEDPARGSALAADPCPLRATQTARRAGAPLYDMHSRDKGSRSFCDEINRAGRQRMLSQRMVKSWLMLEHRVLPRPARQVLRQSIDLFDRQLAQLEYSAGSAQSHAARAELAELWRPYKTLLTAEPNRKTAHALYGMSEEVLHAAHTLTMSFEKADGTRKGRLLNLAGRQRMLSQRMAKFFLFQHSGIQASRCRKELRDAGEEFSAALVKLASATRDKPDIAAELEGVAEHWNSLRSVIATRDESNFATSARKVFTTSESLLQRMDMAVELYARLPG